MPLCAIDISLGQQNHAAQMISDPLPLEMPARCPQTVQSSVRAGLLAVMTDAKPLRLVTFFGKSWMQSL